MARVRAWPGDPVLARSCNCFGSAYGRKQAKLFLLHLLLLLLLREVVPQLLHEGLHDHTGRLRLAALQPLHVILADMVLVVVG